MSSHTLNHNHSFLKKVINLSFKPVFNLLKQAYTALISVRKEQATYRVAKILHSTEYKNQSFAYVYNMVKSGKVWEMEK